MDDWIVVSRCVVGCKSRTKAHGPLPPSLGFRYTSCIGGLGVERELRYGEDGRTEGYIIGIQGGFGRLLLDMIPTEFGSGLWVALTLGMNMGMVTVFLLPLPYRDFLGNILFLWTVIQDNNHYFSVM